MRENDTKDCLKCRNFVRTNARSYNPQERFAWISHIILHQPLIWWEKRSRNSPNGLKSLRIFQTGWSRYDTQKKSYISLTPCSCGLRLSDKKYLLRGIKLPLRRRRRSGGGMMGCKNTVSDRALFFSTHSAPLLSSRPHLSLGERPNAKTVLSDWECLTRLRLSYPIRSLGIE